MKTNSEARPRARSLEDGSWPSRGGSAPPHLLILEVWDLFVTNLLMGLDLDSDSVNGEFVLDLLFSLACQLALSKSKGLLGLGLADLAQHKVKS